MGAKGWDVVNLAWRRLGIMDVRDINLPRWKNDGILQVGEGARKVNYRITVSLTHTHRSRDCD